MRIRESPCVGVGDRNYGHLVIFWRRKTQRTIKMQKSGLIHCRWFENSYCGSFVEVEGKLNGQSGSY